MGPSSSPANPTYRQVCSGDTGHVEVYHFEYTNGIEAYRELVRFFFKFHDPTTLNAQGNDQGTQYASVIYTYNQEQFDVANEVINELQQLIDTGKVTSYVKNKVRTDVRAASTFYPADESHQEYLDKNPSGYCNHRYRFKVWPELN
jgi:peptide-methionine (S)-S-oxide reductase